MIDSPIEVYHCGTAGPGWLSGGHPDPSEGEVARTVNFVWAGKDAYQWKDIKVLNCNNDYFVYYLVDSPGISGYCTE